MVFLQAKHGKWPTQTKNEKEAEKKAEKSDNDLKSNSEKDMHRNIGANV